MRAPLVAFAFLLAGCGAFFAGPEDDPLETAADPAAATAAPSEVNPHPLVQDLGSTEEGMSDQTLREFVLAGKPAVPELVKALDHDDPLVRGNAVAALGTIREPSSLIPVTRLLDDEDPGVRSRVLAALSRFRDPRAVDPLIASLKDADPTFAREAVEVLRVLTGQDPGTSWDAWSSWRNDVR